MNRTSSLLLSTSLLLFVTSCSLNTLQENKIIKTEYPLYTGEIPGSITTSNLEIVKHRKNNNIVIGKVTHPTITGYIPQTSDYKMPAVIICPGGGYGGLSMINEGSAVAERFANAGVAAFVLKYRMPLTASMKDKQFGPLQDVQQAIKLLRINSEEWNIDENKVGVMGFSAGGHLASSAAVHYRKEVAPNDTSFTLKPDFQVLIYPVISFQEGTTHRGSRRNLLGDDITKYQMDFFSSDQQVDNNTPPAFIVHASDDKAVIVDNSLKYHKALNEQNVDSQLLILPTGGHGFGMNNEFDWFDSLTMWMKTNKLTIQ